MLIPLVDGICLPPHPFKKTLTFSVVHAEYLAHVLRGLSPNTCNLGAC